jgi:membrane associated rhomboid family serine protease
MTWGLEHDAHWWQLWTCHVAHWDLRHLALNMIAAAPPVVLAPRRMRTALLPWTVCVAPLLSIAILTGASVGEYRGASGLVVAAWVFTGIVLVRRDAVWPGTALLACITLKLVIEILHGMPSSPTFETLSLVHYAGAAAGAISGLAWPAGFRTRIIAGGESCS